MALARAGRGCFRAVVAPDGGGDHVRYRARAWSIGTPSGFFHSNFGEETDRGAREGRPAAAGAQLDIGATGWARGCLLTVHPRGGLAAEGERADRMRSSCDCLQDRQGHASTGTFVNEAARQIDAQSSLRRPTQAEAAGRTRPIEVFGAALRRGGLSRAEPGRSVARRARSRSRASRRVCDAGAPIRPHGSAEPRRSAASSRPWCSTRSPPTPGRARSPKERFAYLFFRAATRRSCRCG